MDLLTVDPCGTTPLQVQLDFKGGTSIDFLASAVSYMCTSVPVHAEAYPEGFIQAFGDSKTCGTAQLRNRPDLDKLHTRPCSLNSIRHLSDGQADVSNRSDIQLGKSISQ